MHSSLNAITSMRALEFITGHVIYNPAYTYKFQLKTTQNSIERNKPSRMGYLYLIGNLCRKSSIDWWVNNWVRKLAIWQQFIPLFLNKIILLHKHWEIILKQTIIINENETMLFFFVSQSFFLAQQEECYSCSVTFNVFQM